MDKLSQRWAAPSNAWIDNTKYIYSNNPDGRIAEYVSQNWNATASVWNNYQRAIYTYNTLSTDEVSSQALRFYPNPASNTLHISLAENTVSNIKIFDLNGKLVMTTRPITNSTEIDVRILAPDAYFIQLQQGNDVTTKKFIKK